MKRKLFFSFAIILLSTGIFFNSCTKDDNIAPVITVTGDVITRISLNTVYLDPGANATDDVDGTNAVESDFTPLNPNTNLEGAYTINYYSMDNGGNKSHATRTVIVSNDAKALAGNYNVRDVITGKMAGIYNYTVTVNPSNTINNLLLLTNFSGLGGSVTVSAMVEGSTVKLDPAIQAPLGMPVPGNILKGSGNIVTVKITDFNYEIGYIGGGTDKSTSTWTKL